MNRLNFDYTSEQIIGGERVSYGIIEGNENILLIKAGLGGDHLGYDNKYLKIADNLNKIHGCSVLSISNPNSRLLGAELDRRLLLDFSSHLGFDSGKLYLFACSNGCIKGLELASLGVEFNRMMLINMPLMINFHKSCKILSAIKNTEIITVYGEKDPSFPYIPYLRGKSERLSVLTVDGADHNFCNMTDRLINLSEKLII